MPNWVTTIVHAIKDDADFSKFVGEDGNFTFQKIVPMPESEEKNWYNWDCEHWGTKWDACEPRVESKTTVKFQTAWSFARPVMKELAKMVGGLVCFYADEDIGSNCGAVIINERGVEKDISPAEAYALVLWGMDPSWRSTVLSDLSYYIQEEE